LADQGYLEEGIAQMRQALAAYQATGAQLPKTRIMALLAEALGKVGQPEEGLRGLAEALAMVDNGGERDYEAELYRLRGELMLAGTGGWRLGTGSSSPQAPSLQPLVPKEVVRKAEEAFLKALHIARQQHAKTLELRAAMSLVRLRQQQLQHATRNTQHAIYSQRIEAHRMLSEVYQWFTESFDTQDLQEAKALLDKQ
jgi:predicted ATPase